MTRTRKTLIGALVAIIAFAAVVAAAKGLRTLAPVEQFVQDYPGTAPLPAGAPVGIPSWLAWQHFFNAFLLVLVVRTGWIIRSKTRPPAFWTRNDSSLMALTGRRQRLGIYHWFHLSLDAFWVLNGMIFVVLLWVTGQWMRIVPTDPSVFLHALSAALQYASFDWPTENAWVAYNSLQVLTYFTTVFIAAPVAIATGVRLSPLWPLTGSLARVFPESMARSLHGIVMFYFLGFTLVHVALVFLTGVLRNLNIMFAGNDGTSWLGAGVFALTVAVTVLAWRLATPTILKRLASVSGEVR